MSSVLVKERKNEKTFFVLRLLGAMALLPEGGEETVRNVVSGEETLSEALPVGDTYVGRITGVINNIQASIGHLI